MNSKLSLAAVLLLFSAGEALASKAYDCRHYGKGEGILTNITKRFFGDSDDILFLQGHVLKVTRDDADAAKNIAKASLKTGSNCGALSTAVDNLAKKMDEQIAEIDKAKPVCRTIPAKDEDSFKCSLLAKEVFKKEREAANLLKTFVTAAQANPSCTTLAMNDQSKLAADTPEAVFIRLQKKPCKRDGRCTNVRVGKIREARAELHKIEAGGKDEAPPELLGAWSAVKKLLFNQNGEATNAQPPEDAGAENIMWHMQVFNDHYGGQSDDDTHLIFLAAAKISQASLILQKGWDAAGCDSAVAADPQNGSKPATHAAH